MAGQWRRPTVCLRLRRRTWAGIRNLLALQQVVQNQSVPFEFEHMAPLMFPCNLPTLVISEAKSILPASARGNLRRRRWL